jgi:hypothetical protein
MMLKPMTLVPNLVIDTVPNHVANGVQYFPMHMFDIGEVPYPIASF